MWQVLGVIIIAALLVGSAAFFAIIPREQIIRKRLSQILRPQDVPDEKDFTVKQKERVENLLQNAGQLIPSSRGQTSDTRKLLIRAGFRKPEAFSIFQGAKVILPGILIALAVVTRFYTIDPIAVFLALAVFGYLIPDFWLTSRIHGRQKRILLGLPDALDLLTVCVEAGLGLDQGLLRVADELVLVWPELSEELKLANIETRLGTTRADALRGLGERTGVEELRTTTAMLIQTDRFGTDLAQALRVHADTTRLRRRQRAEELAARASVKMVFPLVFFIFPAMFAVILGPALLIISNTFKTAF